MLAKHRTAGSGVLLTRPGSRSRNIPENGLSSRRDASSSRPEHEVVIGKGCLQRAAAIC